MRYFSIKDVNRLSFSLCIMSYIFKSYICSIFKLQITFQTHKLESY